LHLGNDGRILTAVRKSFAPIAASLHYLNLYLIGLLIVYTGFRAVLEEGLDLSETSTTSRQVGDLLMFAVLCAFASFAAVEVLKRLFNLRGWYQLERTKSWFAERAPEHDDRAFEQLVDAIGISYGSRDVGRLFNLPTEQLAAQVGVAADIALISRENPARADEQASSRTGYEALIAALAGTGREGQADVTEDERYLAQRVRTGVDQLQITLGQDWRRAVQGAVMWIAGLFAIGLSYVADVGSEAHARYVLVALILGGVLAWSLRDLSRVIENARR
jgi:hypothetical protein